MTTQDVITAVACAGQLGLASVALARISKSPLALPLALLCLDLFVFNAGDVTYHLTGVRQWVWLDTTAASLLAPITVRFTLAFVGRSRSLRWVARGFDVYFGVIALACAAAFVGVEWSRDFAGTQRWVMALAPGAVLAVGVLGWLLVSHLRASHSAVERSRTWLVIAGFGLGTVGNALDLFANAGFDVPRLGPLGTLVTTLALAMAALRFGLFDRPTSGKIAAAALLVGSLLIGAYSAVFQLFGGTLALIAVGIGTLSLALVPALWAMLRAGAAQRQRLEYHATLGRFSAQMAHDLRNPLAAIKGAAQLLQGDAALGKPMNGRFLTLVVEQANRLDRVIADYQRIGRMDPVLAPVNLNTVVEQVLGGQDLAAPAGVTIERRLDATLPVCPADAGLLATVLENLVRNAFEAMAKGGVVTVQTEHGPKDPGFVRLAVTDTGSGMDARLAEQAFSDFFTTKTTGSGLGLAFVRRVAEAHGGDASLKSDEGKGTTVRVRLPF